MANQAKPIPEGFHTVTPYLIVKDGLGAIEFYKKAFGAVVVACETSRPDGRMMNAEIRIGDSMLMMGEHADIGLPESQALPLLSIYLYVEDADAVAKAAIEAGAAEISPVTDKFYGNREGGVQDPFGITWWVATHKEDLTAEEIAKRAEAFFSQQSQ